MTKSPTPTRTAWARRSAALLVVVVASVGLLPATAGATSPPPSNDAHSSDGHSGHGHSTDRRSTDAHSTDVPSASAHSTDRPSTSASSADALPSVDAAPHSPVHVRLPASASSAVPPSAATRAADWHVVVEPAAQTVREGQKAVFTASYTSSTTPGAAVTIRWQSAPAPTGPWTDLAGADGTVLTSTATHGMDGALLRAVASIAQQSFSSPPVILHVQPATDPAGQAANCPTPLAPTNTGAPCPSPGPTPSSAALTPSAGATYGTVALPVVELGQQQTATGHNFTPGTLVKITLEPDSIELGTATVAPDGTVTTRFATKTLLAGPHTVTWTPNTATPPPTTSPSGRSRPTESPARTSTTPPPSDSTATRPKH
jgi:hypothetical protein